MAMPYKQCPPRICEHCETLFDRKPLEAVPTFRRRRFCSLSCANSKHVVTEGTLRWRARKLRGSTCEACGATTCLQAHHVDQDPANNALENIQTLCKTCHDFWHATQKRRGWPIAGRMPALEWDGRTASLASPMGFPSGWTDCEPSATASSLKSPNGSAGGSSSGSRT